MDLETSIGFPDCLVDSVWACIVYGYLEFDMNDGLTDEQANEGNRVLIFLLLLFTSPFWVGFLVHTFWS